MINEFGHIKNYPVNTIFNSRKEIKDAGLHFKMANK